MHFTVGQLSRYLSINEPSDLETAACYFNCSVNEVRKRSADDLDIAIERMEDYNSIPAVYQDRLWLNNGEWNNEGKGVEYGIINDWSRLELGEYIDIKEFQQEFYANATKILSILYRPVTVRYGHSYKIEEYKGVEGHEVFNSLPAQYLNGAMLFFSTVRKNCARTSASYLTRKASQTSSVKSGGGMDLWQRWRATFSASRS